MSVEPQKVRRQEIDRAVAAVEGLDAPARLAALAYDALGGQAEGRTLLAGDNYAASKAKAHDVDRDAAETDAGNVLGILERGASDPVERALLAALMVRGLDDALAAGEDKGRAFRFVRHADWLELSTDYVVYPFVDRLMAEDRAALVWAEVAQRVVDDAAGRDGDRPRVRALNAGRLSALASSPSKAAAGGLRDVVKSAALDEPTRLLASTLAGDGDAPAPGPRPQLEGHLGRAPRSSALEVLRWLTGWALLSWLLRGLGFLVGLRRRARLRLADDGVEVHTEIAMLGRTVSERDETWRLDALDGVGRRVRYPAIHLVAGAVALSVGVLFGGLVLFDGVRSGELVLLLLASGLLFGGAALDLALDVLVPARAGRVALELSPRARRPLRLTRVPLEQADAFLRALRAQAAGRASQGRP